MIVLPPQLQTAFPQKRRHTYLLIKEKNKLHKKNLVQSNVQNILTLKLRIMYFIFHTNKVVHFLSYWNAITSAKKQNVEYLQKEEKGCVANILYHTALQVILAVRQKKVFFCYPYFCKNREGFILSKLIALPTFL